MASNKTLELLNQIDVLVSNECPDICTDDDADRAKLAWWIMTTFCQGDYRQKLRMAEIKEEQKEQGDTEKITIGRMTDTIGDSVPKKTNGKKD